MITINVLLEELRNVPVHRLEELYALIRSLRAETKSDAASRNQILSFAGAFSDFADEDYKDFLEHTTATRNNLFDRNFPL